MNTSEKRNIKLYCEICTENPATDIKGGKIIINGIEKRDMFLCCKECKKKIEDTRLNE